MRWSPLVFALVLSGLLSAVVLDGHSSRLSLEQVRALRAIVGGDDMKRCERTGDCNDAMVTGTICDGSTSFKTCGDCMGGSGATNQKCLTSECTLNDDITFCAEEDQVVCTPNGTAQCGSADVGSCSFTQTVSSGVGCAGCSIPVPPLVCVECTMSGCDNGAAQPCTPTKCL